MRGVGVSGDCPRPRTRSRMKTVKGSTVRENLDNIVLIDVDCDGFDSVIIIDVPEPLQQKLRGSSVLREGKRFLIPGIICIDDDDDESDDIECLESYGHGGGELNGDGTSSSSGPSALDNMCNSVDAEANDCRVIHTERPAFKLSTCKRPLSMETFSGNCNILESELDSGSSQGGFCDFEVMEGSLGELSEQWKKAHLRRKSNVKKGPKGPEPQASHNSTDHDLDVENRTKQNVEAPVCSSSSHVNFERVDSSAASATGDGIQGACSFNPSMQSPFASCEEKAGKESDAQCSPTRTCFQGSEKKTMGERSFLNFEQRPNLHSDCEEASFQAEDLFPCKLHCSSVMHNIHQRRVVFKEKGKEFTQQPFSWETCSSEAQFKSPSSEEKGIPVSGEMFMSSAPSSEYTVIRNAMDGIRAVPEESFRPPSWIEPVVTLEKAGQHGVQKINSGEMSFCTSQCHETLSKPGTSTLPEGNESFTDAASNITKRDERDLICGAPTDSVLNFQRDIINVREELKKTDEYKLAVEEEWAARHLQLKLQAEEAQRMRKRRKAESLRVLDIQKRQRQRVEEVRATQKEDEEKLNVKESLRAQVRQELHRLEMMCFDMASLLRGLGIHVGGGFPPLSHEVHAAYKRALLKFHPDRASRNDIRQQVEAEEKFKLISRMKEKFLTS